MVMIMEIAVFHRDDDVTVPRFQGNLFLGSKQIFGSNTEFSGVTFDILLCFFDVIRAVFTIKNDTEPPLISTNSYAHINLALD